jgi:hypothetical protein
VNNVSITFLGNLKEYILLHFIEDLEVFCRRTTKVIRAAVVPEEEIMHFGMFFIVYL